MDIKGVAGEGSEENEKGIRNWREGDPCYIVAESLVALYPAVRWKAGLVSNEFGYLTEISKQNVEVWLGFFLPLVG